MTLKTVLKIMSNSKNLFTIFRVLILFFVLLQISCDETVVTLHGMVLFEKDKSPAAEQKVVINSTDVITDNKGTFDFSASPNLTVVIEREGFNKIVKNYDSSDNDGNFTEVYYLKCAEYSIDPICQ